MIEPTVATKLRQLENRKQGRGRRLVTKVLGLAGPGVVTTSPNATG